MESSSSLSSCDFCEKSIAKLKCPGPGCKKGILFCDSCFSEYHDSRPKEGHTPIPIEAKPMCKVDTTLEAEYICPECKAFFCAKCIESKYHEGHSIISNVQIKEIFDKTCEEYQKTSEKISTDILKIKESSKLRNETFLKQLGGMKDEINKSGIEISSELKHKTDYLLHKLFLKDDENFCKLDAILKKADEALKLLASKKELVSNFKSQSDNILLRWVTLIAERNLITQLEKEFTDLAKLDIMNPEILIMNPVVNLSPIIKEIRHLSFIPSDSEKYSQKNSILLFQENYSKKTECQSLTFERRLLYYINKKEFESEVNVGVYNNSYGTYSGIPSCFRDLATMKFYTSINDSVAYEVKEYANIQGFFNNFPCKIIKIPSGFCGTYHIANDNFLYANIYNTNKIGKFSLDKGDLVEQLEIVDALLGGEGNLSGGSYQYISLLQDEANNSFYVFYQKKGELKSILFQITLTPKMQIIKSWNIPFLKCIFGFCLIYDNLFYLGFYSAKPYFSLAFDLIGECIRIIPEIILPSKVILSINYFANLEMIIFGETAKIRKICGIAK